jgi:hypothetical protein
MGDESLDEGFEVSYNFILAFVYFKKLIYLCN